jgi:hypothetical protein
MFDVELYGAYRTQTFAEVFPTYEDFLNDYIGHPLFQDEINTALVYHLLFASYANSHISNSSINQFIDRLYQTIFMYGPSWQKRLDIQKKLRELTDEDILKGGSAIYNHAFNDGGAPSADSTVPLDYINQQNTTHYKKSKMDSYATLLSLIETDVTREFIDKFKPLFLKIVAPELPLLYYDEIQGE